MNVGYDTATTQTEACIKKIMSNFSKPPTSYATSIPAKLPHLHESLAKRVNRSLAIVIRRGTCLCPALYACTQKNIWA